MEAEETMPEGEETPAEESTEATAEDNSDAVAMAAMALLDGLFEKGLPAGVKSIKLEGLDTDAPSVTAEGDGDPVTVEIEAEELARRAEEMSAYSEDEGE